MGRTRPLRRVWGFGCLRGRGGAEVRSVGTRRLCGGCADVGMSLWLVLLDLLGVCGALGVSTGKPTRGLANVCVI